MDSRNGIVVAGLAPDLVQIREPASLRHQVVGDVFVAGVGGLRGGISIALALSLSQDMNRELFLVITYIVVVVSILGQGLTVEPFIKRLTRTSVEQA